MKRFAIVVSAASLLTITPGRLIFVAAEHDRSPEQSLLVSATWPNLPYDIAVAGGDWLAALPELGRAPGRDSSGASSSVSTATGDRVRVRVDPSPPKPGHYSATLTFSAWQAAGATAVAELTVLAN